MKKKYQFKNDNKVVLSTRVDKEFRNRIESVAKKNGVKASNVVLEFLVNAYNDYLSGEPGEQVRLLEFVRDSLAGEIVPHLSEDPEYVLGWNESTKQTYAVIDEIIRQLEPTNTKRK